ncbi:MAG: hypothetical protein ACI9R3_000814 [Verrucomicrobiales bacterium]|jgi:hypothetical protein
MRTAARDWATEASDKPSELLQTMKTTTIIDTWNTAKRTGMIGLISLVLPLSLVGQTNNLSAPQVRLQPSGGAINIEISGNADGYSIEFSEDLVEWKPLGEAEAGDPGEFGFEDTEASGSAGRFYRVVAKEGNLDTAVIVQSYGTQIQTLGYQSAILETSRAGLQRDLTELHRLLARTQSRMQELESRATENPVVVQGQQEVVVRWNSHQWVFGDPQLIDETMQQIEEERMQAEDALRTAEAETEEILQQIARTDGSIGEVQIEIDALNLMGDELSLSLLKLDDVLWNSPCFQLDLRIVELMAARAERMTLEQDKHSAQVASDRSRADAERARARTWYAFGSDGNFQNREGSALLIFDGKRRHFQTTQEGQQYVQEVVEPTVEQSKVDAELFERDAETHAARVQEICDRIAAIDQEIAALEEEVNQLQVACGQAVDPIQQCQELSFELVTLEAIREMIFNDKIDAALMAADAEQRAKNWQSIADQPAGVAVGNETWVFWDGEIFKFDDPIMADLFLGFIESLREVAAEEAERARAEANDFNERVKVFCDELDEIDALIAIVMADLNAARAVANKNVGGNGQQPAAQKDFLEILIALTEAIRSAVAAEKISAVRDAENLQKKADKLAADANSAVSLVAPEEGKPYFIVQGMGDIVRIPVVPEPGESMEQAIERTRQAAEALHNDLTSQREAAKKDAAVAQDAADAAKRKATKLCDELEGLDQELEDLNRHHANASAAAAAAVKAQLRKAAKGIVDCLKCFFKKIALAAAKSAHAGLVSKANQAEKDATDARNDANAKHDAASKGLSLVINHTDGTAIAAFGDQRFPFNNGNSKDPEGDAREKHRKLKEKRDQAKKDAAAAEKAAKAAEEAAKTAKDEVKISQEAIDKCQKELDELKKNCPLC